MNKAVITLLTVAGLGVGFGAGYLVAKNRYLTILEDELEAYRNDFESGERVVNIYRTPEEAVEALISNEEVARIMEDSGYATGEVKQNDPPTQEEIADAYNKLEVLTAADIEEAIRAPKNVDEDGIEHRNLWDEPIATQNELLGLPDENGASPLPERIPGRPYVITYEEFMHDDEHKDDKISLVYFQDGDTLVDDDENVIDDSDGLIGDENLQYFGVGSQDKNTVYVRNESLGADFEILRDRRSYLQVVHGVSPHPTKNSPRKMRNDDE